MRRPKWRRVRAYAVHALDEKSSCGTVAVEVFMEKTVAAAWLVLLPLVWVAPHLAQFSAMMDKEQSQTPSSAQMDHDKYVQTFLKAGSGLVVYATVTGQHG